MDINEKKARLKKILSQISGDFGRLEGPLITPMMIRGSGVLFCYQPSTREMVKINRGTVIYIVDPTETEDEKYLVYTFEGHVVLLHTEEIEPIGFN
jgi:hypothetical protein